MALKKAKKKELVQTFDGILKDAGSVVFVKFNKLPVAASNTLRRSLQSEEVLYKVVKKTLLKRSLDAKNIEGEMPVLEGEIAIAYGKDLIAPARGVYSFQKDHKDLLSISGGIFEGKYMDAVAMMGIATIPSREVLLSQIAYLLKSPMQRLAIAVNEVSKGK